MQRVAARGSRSSRSRATTQGINLDVTKLDRDHLESALRDLGEMEVDDGKSHVRISYE
jgi:hypothetical protein